jgi:hypothetical protein
MVHTSWQSMQNNNCPVLDVLAIEIHAMILIDSLPANNCAKPEHQIHAFFIFKTNNLMADYKNTPNTYSNTTSSFIAREQEAI